MFIERNRSRRMWVFFAAMGVALALGLHAACAQAEIVLSEDFSNGVPPDWEIVDGGNDGNTWAIEEDPWTWFEPVFSAPFIEAYYAYYDFALRKDEQLLTPVLDLSSAQTAALSFGLYYDAYPGNSFVVEAQRDGGPWQTLFNTADYPGSGDGYIFLYGQVSLDISEAVAGSSQVRLRFYDREIQYAWLTRLDSIIVEANGAYANDQGADNTPETANTLQLEEVQDQSLFPGNDADWFRLTLTEPASIFVEVTSEWYPILLGAYLPLEDGNMEPMGEMGANGGGPFVGLAAPLPAGTYLIQVSSWMTQGLGMAPAYSIRASEILPDAFEPDNSWQEAALLEFDTPQDHTLDTAGDVDWFIFNLPDAAAVVIASDSIFGYAACDLYAAANLDVPIESGLYWGITRYLEAGEYRVRISNGYPEVASVLPAYSLSLRYFTPDQLEPNDTKETAAGLEPYYPFSLSIDSPTDEDWFVFTLDALTAVNIQTSGNWNTPGTRLWLYDGAGQELAFNDDAEDWNPYSEITATLAPGKYYARVLAEADATFLEYYWLYFTTFEPDAYEPDDTYVEAKPVEWGAVQDHSLYPGDVDWLVFTLDAPQIIRVDVASGVPEFYVAIRLLDGQLQLLQQVYYSGNPESTKELYYYLEAGTYYVQVQESYLYESAAYQIACFMEAPTPDAYEPNGGPETAVLLESNTTLSGASILPPGDEDWATFAVTETSSVVLETFTEGAPLSLTLYDAALTPIETAGRIGRFLEPGTYYVRVAAQDTAAFNLSYDLRLHVIPGAPPSALEYRFERMLPTLQQPWYFMLPTDVIIDSRESVYVCDPINRALHKFTMNGQFIERWDIPSEGGARPVACAVSPSGYVYIARGDIAWKSAGSAVLVYDPAGTLLGAMPLPATSLGIAAPSDDLVLATLLDANTVLMGDSAGNLLGAWGETGSGYGTFNAPTGINVVNGDIYVCDTGNELIQVFDQNGGFLRQWRTPGTITYDTLEGPVRIVGDAQGNLLVTHAELDEVLRYSPSGDLLGRWASPQFANEAITQRFYLPQPSGIAVAGNGWTLVGNQNVQVFDQSAQIQTTWSSFGNRPGEFMVPVDVAIDAAGNYFVVEVVNKRVQKFAPDGTLLAMWGSEGTGDGQFIEPMNIVAAPSGVIYVSDSGSGANRIQAFAPDGTFLAAVPIDTPGGLDATPDGNIAVSGYDGVTVFTPLGEPVAFFEAPSSEFIAVDRVGNIYLTSFDEYAESPVYIYKYAPDGTLLTVWDAQAAPGGFFYPGIAVDAENNVFVADQDGNTIRKFTSEGIFLQTVATGGTGPGSVIGPRGMAFDAEGRFYVAEATGNRVQILRPVSPQQEDRAIIVAGGGPFPGNNLWDTTQFCANYAYRALVHQGLTKDTIYYLSADRNLDLDGNGVADDVDDVPTNAHLQYALTQWAGQAKSLTLYLVDHGGLETFRMSETETLSASDLGSWLNSAAAGIAGTTTVIYDACQAGSFLDSLSGSRRIVATSANAGESAYFLGTGTISFSNFFWTEIFNGSSVGEAFDTASDAVGLAIGLQTPEIRDPDALADNTYLGNGMAINRGAPEILSISEPTHVEASIPAAVDAEATDPDGIVRVWAEVRRPDFSPPSASEPVMDLPYFDLQHGEGELWTGLYDHFDAEGAYTIAVYARDRIGNTSAPALTTYTVGDALLRRAILVVGEGGDPGLTDAFANVSGLAYETVLAQGYTAETVQVLGSSDLPGYDQDLTLDNLESVLTQWAATDTEDLVLYLVGLGGYELFQLNAQQTVSAQQLDAWLNALQRTIPGPVAVVYDACQSGSFLPRLTSAPGRIRINLCSSRADQPALFLSDGNVSFSYFFWSQVVNGASIGECATQATVAMRFSSLHGQEPQLDDDGNGAGNQLSDGSHAAEFTIGTGYIAGADDPAIGDVSPGRSLTGQSQAVFWVENITATSDIVSVHAVITPPSGVAAPNSCIPVTPLVQLEPVGGGRYQGVYSGFLEVGTYDLALYAKDANDRISLPAKTTVEQTAIPAEGEGEGEAIAEGEGEAIGEGEGEVIAEGEGEVAPVVREPDAFEPDNTRGTAVWIGINSPEQSHSFHQAQDEDWVRFYAKQATIVTVETKDLGGGADTAIEIYGSDGALIFENDNRGAGDPSSYVIFTANAEGLYWARVRYSPDAVFPSTIPLDTSYTVKVYEEAGGGAIITGTIACLVRSPQEKALAGATVTIEKLAFSLNSDADGLCLFWAISEGAYTLHAQAAGYVSKDVSVELGPAENKQMEIVLASNVKDTPDTTEGEGEAKVEGEPEGEGEGGTGTKPFAFLGCGAGETSGDAAIADVLIMLMAGSVLLRRNRQAKRT